MFFKKMLNIWHRNIVVFIFEDTVKSAFTIVTANPCTQGFQI